MTAQTMDDLRTQLQAALGSAFTIERELGGGGMSRVFVARENALGRQVVVKVLPAEAAGVSIDRFRREIATAANLQHPNIVPVLSAGEMEGIPFYTMPLVDGETLRQRLAKHGELSIEESIQVLRQVADALSYAHERGVVHRDIKPENILLTKKHALVVDFGVAKAMAGAAASPPDESGAPHGSLTSLGVALGTPAYMAPEQATADPSTDHRADIYALGCVGYELLTGYQLFPGRSPQATLAAHAMEPPDPVLNRRPSTPPVLADLVMRCLEKRPGDRPQSATEVERVLATLSTTPGSGSQPTTVTRPPAAIVRRRRTLLLSGGALLTAAAVLLYASGRAPDVPLNENVIAVAPFRVSADPALAYLREGMLDLLAANLTGEGGPRATDPRASLAAWRQAGGDGVDATEEESRNIARRLGAARLLLGSIVGSGNRLVITATVVSTADGKRGDVRVEGSVDSLTHLVDQLTAEVLSRTSASGAQLSGRLASVPLPAVRAWLDGQASYRRARYDEAVGHFASAVRIDSTFLPAAISGLIAASWSSVGAPPPELQTAFLYAWNRRASLAARDRVMVTALAAIAGNVLPPGSVDGPRSWMFLRDSAALVAPDIADLWHLIGDDLFHFGPARMPREDAHAQARAAFERVLSIDSSYASAYEHLVDDAILAGDTARARWAATRYLDLDSLADHADYIRWRLTTATGDSVEQDRMRERIGGMSTANARRIAGTALMAALDPRDVQAAVAALGRQASTPLDQIGYAVSRFAMLANRGQLASLRPAANPLPFPGAPPAVGNLARWGWLAFEDEEASAAVARTAETWLATQPGGSPATAVPQYIAACSLAQWHLSQRDPVSAERAIARMRLVAPAAIAAGIAGMNTQREPLCLTMTEAWLAVERGQPDARQLVAQLDSLSGNSGVEVGRIELVLTHARLLESVGDLAAALRMIRRVPYHHDAAAVLPLAVIAREEGRLAALAGDREGAIRAYRRYLALRVEPDESLKPEVDHVRQELARLEREGAGR